METEFLDIVIDKLWAIETESNKDPLEFLRSVGECTNPKLSELLMIIRLLGRINMIKDRRGLLDHMRKCSGLIGDDELDSIPSRIAVKYNHDRWQLSKLYYDFIYRTRRDYSQSELIIISDIIQYLEELCYRHTIYSNLIFYDPAIWNNAGTNGVAKLSGLLKILKDTEYISSIITLYIENELNPPNMLLDLVEDGTSEYPMKYGIFYMDCKSGAITSYNGFNSIISYCISYYDIESIRDPISRIAHSRIAANHIGRSLIHIGDNHLSSDPILKELLDRMILTYDSVELPLIHRIINKLDYLKFGL